MTARVLFIGAGDVGMQMAGGLLGQCKIDHLVLSDWNAGLAPRAAMLGYCHGTQVSFQQVDGRDKSALEALIRGAGPDLIVQCASLISPWSIIGHPHPTAQILSSAGISVQIPAQLPILLNVMEVVHDMGLDVPVANIAMPDILHPVLATRGLAPTIGLGNVSIHHLRVKHRLLQDDVYTGDEQVRVLGHHCQVYDVMKSQFPSAEADRVQVYIGDDTSRQDKLAYQGVPFAAGPIYNEITAASALPVLKALLPDAVPLNFSAPAPMGLPGGYPVSINGRDISLDLPASVTRANAIAFNERQGKRDGVERIESDGTVVFTQAVRDKVSEIDPSLADPIDLANLLSRTELLLRVVAGIT